MVVVEEFATKFKIQFAIKLRNALFDVLRLNALIFFVVKSYFHNACKVTAFLLERKIEREFFEGRTNSLTPNPSPKGRGVIRLIGDILA